MNSIRAFLGLVYLLLMVLLPWLHMPLHAHTESTEPTCSSGCTHSDAPAEDSHDHKDCGLCHLAVIPAELPPIFITPAKPRAVALETVATDDAFQTQEPCRPHQARAPPFQTV